MKRDYGCAVVDGRRPVLEFRVLGPLQVAKDGRPLPLGGFKQRELLALLLLDRNRVVPRDRLVDTLWGERPPARLAPPVRSSPSPPVTGSAFGRGSWTPTSSSV